MILLLSCGNKLLKIKLSWMGQWGTNVEVRKTLDVGTEGL